MLHRFIGGAVGASALICLSALPASAQSLSGSVNVTGSVGAFCVALSPLSTTINETIALGELADADGTLKDTLIATADGSPAGFKQFFVLCNSATPTVTLTATPLTTGGAAPAGFANTVRYTAELDADLLTGPNVEHTYDTATLTGTATAATALGGALSFTNPNVVISLYALNTPNVADILVAGSYTAAIAVTIAPN